MFELHFCTDGRPVRRGKTKTRVAADPRLSAGFVRAFTFDEVLAAAKAAGHSTDRPANDPGSLPGWEGDGIAPHHAHVSIRPEKFLHMVPGGLRRH